MSIFFQDASDAGGSRDFPKTIGNGGSLQEFLYENGSFRCLSDGDVFTPNCPPEKQYILENLGSQKIQIWGLPGGAYQKIMAKAEPGDWFLLFQGTGKKEGGFSCPCHYAGEIIGLWTGDCSLSGALWREEKFPVIVLLKGFLLNGGYSWGDLRKDVGYADGYSLMGFTSKFSDEKLQIVGGQDNFIKKLKEGYSV